MSNTCFQLESLAEIVEAAADDPRRAHLGRCPRCRARLAAYARFMAEDDTPAGADPKAAQAHLEAKLAELLRSPAPRSFGPVARPAGSSYWRRPRTRLVMTMAAVLVAAIGLSVVTRVGDGPSSPPVLRGDLDPAPGAFQPTAAVQADGAVRLSWQLVPEAEGYRVIFYAADLQAASRRKTGTQTQLVVSREDLDGVFYWRVVALRGGDPVTRSAPQPLDLP